MCSAIEVRRSVILHTARSLNQSAGPSLVECVVVYDVIHGKPLQRGPRQFFVATSCKIALSKLSSATSFFKRAFSSWSS